MRKTHYWRLWAAMFAVVFTLCSSQLSVAQEDKDEAEEAPAPQIEIRGFGDGGGGFGGFALPEGFKEMMKAAQEMQELQTKYQTSVDELIAAAKALEQTENLMDSVTKVSKLAKKSEELKAEIAKKQEAMAKKIGGGAVFGGGGIGIGGFGGAEGGVKIVPLTPRVEFKVEGIELEIDPDGGVKPAADR